MLVFLPRLLAGFCCAVGLSVAALDLSQAEAQSLACASLMAEDFSHVPDAPTQITAALEVLATDSLPAYCKVEGYIAPTIGFEIRVPTDIWNSKLLMQGCGGFCGTTAMIAQCDDALARGYACVSTDLGHKSTPIDAKWAYNNPQGEIDFYYRATHATAQASKAIVTRLRGQQIERSYFRGCSTGGRQGLVSAQRFPADFDGIIAAAPAGVSPGGGLHLIWSALANLDAQGAQILPARKIPLLHEAVLKACDADDGLKDGLIDDPRTCGFDPASLRCSGADRDSCLTAPQVEAVRRIYKGATDPGGTPLYRAVPMPGSELNWVPAYVGVNGQPSIYYHFGGDFFRYVAFAEDPGPDWRPEDFDFATDPPRMGYNRHLNNAASPDLRAYVARGGKLISYQGWSDQSVPPLGVIDYLDDVERFMGGQESVSEFFRVFMLPGVAHCVGGEGPSRVDALSALEAWVETGEAPDQLIAYKLKADPGAFAAAALPPSPDNIEMSRPVYPYPDVARHVTGNPNEWTNFKRLSLPAE
ncbi:MAG: tannase/feruloyl esterase family alpha/beta hydrolase [Rhodospirillaceae bacterium]